MKLIRVGSPGEEVPGVLLNDGRRIDTSSHCDDYDEAFFASDGLAGLANWLESHLDGAPEFDGDARLGPPVARPGKIVCIGLNFRDHARETGTAIPKEPIIFMKASSALCGPNDDLVIPPGSTKMDYEVELAFIIARAASHVSESDALDHVAGYTLMNDYSERAFQIERGGQWVKGKSSDTFAPLGPHLLTTDELPDIDDLRMWLEVNGESRQESSTSNLIFGVSEIVSYLSRFMTLLPGDVVSTGTPAGVGMGFDPPRYLNPGDLVELGIDELGQSAQRAVSWESTGRP